MIIINEKLLSSRELVTKVWQIPKEKFSSVYLDDDETAGCGKKLLICLQVRYSI